VGMARKATFAFKRTVPLSSKLGKLRETMFINRTYYRVNSVHSELSLFMKFLQEMRLMSSSTQSASKDFR
jgi:hypothetical protein